MKKNKGFTLVELLAVIVILAVIILIAINAVLPQMERARKNSFAGEVMTYAKAAETRYVTESQEDSVEGDITAGICYELSDLRGEYITKDDSKYTGIVIIKKRAGSNIYDKYAYITSGKYKYNNKVSSGNLVPVTKLGQKDIEDGSSLTYANCTAWENRDN